MKHWQPNWRKSSYSAQNTQCVEVAPAPPGEVLVRDGKVPGGGCLAFSAGAWERAVGLVQAPALRS
ncbi:DUF397 domain-containing protein [Streptodolium elevatio]|uniref:DUF397 domain-containing protein n=1 Tax=Streptodolium elevatio TaxID=3157996 RepID=A0ABV3DDT3_9ACTN